MPNTGTISTTAGIEPSCATLEYLIRLEAVSFAYGSGSGDAPAVRDVSLAIRPGEFVALLGPSGCGKTTLLSLIAGYLLPKSGSIVLRGSDTARMPPAERRIGMVFQNYALFPHLSVVDNVGFGLDVRKLPTAVRQARVEAMLHRVGLGSDLWKRKPSALSGGQQQRTAIARALVVEPDVLLLDEPFANLDRRLRESLREELRRLQRSLGVTTILVTHDREEAMQISDRIGILRDGTLLQFDTPEAVYRRPIDRFVAEFVGRANIPSEWEGRSSPGGFLVRPESIAVGTGAEACAWQRLAIVKSAAFVGSGYICEVATDDGLSLSVCVSSTVPPAVGSQLRIGISEADVWPMS